jgi:N-acetylglucosamine-6-phosphate deacetylase
VTTRVLATAAGAWVAIEDGVVTATGDDAAPADATVVGDVVLAPGFVDVQVNGLGDVDFWAADPHAWRRAGRRLLASGVTSYLPTLVSASLDFYDAALGRIAAARRDACDAGLPHVEGAHLEGPFLGGAPGAHPPELLQPVDVATLTRLLDDHPGLVRLVTLAPEADPGLTGTRLLAERDVVVSLGHSRCGYDAAIAAADAGATMVTHLFNGMEPLGHRAPGLPAAALTDDRLTPSLIADFVHVHPAVLGLAARAKPCVLVTDAVAVGVEYGGQAVVERDGAAWLADGTLTGSTLTMDRALRNAAGVVGLDRALPMATITPARILGLSTFGGTGVGGRADLVALDRDDLTVRAVWLAGEEAYARP